MAAFTKLDGKFIFYGLSWGDVPRQEKAKGIKGLFQSRSNGAAKALARRMNAAYRVVFDNGARVRHGFIDDTSTGALEEAKAKKGDVLSAAVLFASRVPPTQNSLLVYKLDDKKAAIIAILNGYPYLDQTILINKVSGALDTLYAETGAMFTNYGNYLNALPDSIKMEPSDLLAGNQKAAALEKYSTNDGLRKALLFGGVVFVAMIAWSIWKKEVARREAELAEQNAIDPIQLYNEAMQNAMRTLGFTGQAALNTLAQAVGTRDIEIGGWVLEKVTCQKSGLCTEKWLIRGGTNATFFMQNKLGKPMFTGDGKEINNSYSVPTKPTALTKASLPPLDPFLLVFSTSMQQLRMIGIAYKLTPPKLYTAGITVTESAIPKTEAVLEGTFQLDGPIGLAEDALRTLPPNATVQSIEWYAATGDVSKSKFTIKGAFYVKN